MERLINKFRPALDDNIKTMKDALGDDKTVLVHRFRPSDPRGAELLCCLFCIDGMVDSTVINDNIIRPVTIHHPAAAIGANRLKYLEEQVLQANEVSESDDFNELIYALLYGDTVLFCDGCTKALVVGTKGFMKRSISEPQGEPLLKGPREGFTEPLLSNLSLLRRKIRSCDFKIEYFRLGSVTRTSCALCYISGCADEKILNELRSRISKVEIDGVLDTNYISELIRENKWSIIRNTGTTERPDVAAAKLMEGRIVLFVDGSPVALTVPYIFIEAFQSPEDYYVSFHFAAINRILRMLGFVLSISIVPVFIALMLFHRELIPTPLLLSMAAARQGVPFGIVMEVLMLLISFELLREAGTRTPATTGQTLSIVGGLVVGQAAVEAHIVSPATLIVIALSGITGLIAPKLKSIIVWVRLALLLASILLGLYGYILGVIWFLLMLAQQSSFGVSSISYLPLVRLGSTEDSIARAPFHVMKRHGRFVSGWGEK